MQQVEQLQSRLIDQETEAHEPLSSPNLFILLELEQFAAGPNLVVELDNTFRSS